MTNETHAALDALIKTLNLNYSAIFIPQSASRNAGEKHASLNWSVSVGPNYGKDPIQRGITANYSQGIAHAPGYTHNFKSDHNKARYFALVAEKGVTLRHLPKFSDGRVDYWQCWQRMDGQGLGRDWCAKLPAPALRDVLHSLVLDSSVIDYASFEDWASEYGFETDSRKAEKLYTDCLAIALKLRALIGSKALADLRDAFQDY